MDGAHCRSHKQRKRAFEIPGSPSTPVAFPDGDEQASVQFEVPFPQDPWLPRHGARIDDSQEPSIRVRMATVSKG